MNDGKIMPSGPCLHHTDGHATKEEAEKHYYDYQVEHLTEVSFTTADKCGVCGVWTEKALTFKSLKTAHLCDAHRTKENWKAKYPFEPGVEITSSW